MGAPKLKNFPPSKKPAEAKDGGEAQDNASEKDKETIEILKKSIAGLVKDPELAKKAAALLQELLEKKK